MIEQGKKLSEMPEVETYSPTHRIPVLRQGSPRNVTIPASVLQSQMWYPDIVSLSGDGSLSLDSLPTLGRTRVLILCHFADELQFWLLAPGSTETDEAAGLLRPLDFHEISNPKIWTRVL
jgi:hypothetical protein